MVVVTKTGQCAMVAWAAYGSGYLLKHGQPRGIALYLSLIHI